MDITLLTLTALVLVLTCVALWRGGYKLIISGFKQAIRNLQSVWLPLIFGFTLGGLVKVLIPESAIAEWIGPASGLKGILIGSYAGVIMGGGPYVNLPIITAIYTAGAGVGPVIAMLSSSNLLGLQGLFVWQIPFLGAKIAIVRYVVCLFVPPFIGFTGSLIYKLLV